MKKTSALLIALAVVSAGCSNNSSSDSGSSTSGPSTAQIQTISGKVSDPAVKGAKVELYDNNNVLYAKCGANANTICNVWTKEDGKFSFVLPLNTDITDFTVKSTGGEDTAYGIEMSVPFYSDLDYFKNNYNNIIVSPVTSLYQSFMKNDMTQEDALEKLSSLLGVDKDVLLKDPETNQDLLKISYILNQTASLLSSDTADNIMDNLANVLSRYDSIKNNLDAILAELFPNDAELVESVKAMYLTVTSISGANVEDILNGIQNAEKTRMFVSAYEAVLNEAAVSEQAVTNITSLFNGIKEKVTLPTSQFQIEQIVRYIASQTINEVNMGEYASFDVTASEFETILSSLTADAGIIENINTLASETVNSTTVPLNSPLGMDNQKRVDYYFNSDKDLNYQAMKLTQLVLDDSIIEEIYSSIISNYASYGLFSKAEKLASVQIKDTLERMQVYAGITNNGYKYYQNDASVKKYIDKAVSDMKVFNEINPEVSNDYVSTYMTFIHSYAAIKEIDDVIVIKDELYNKLNEFPVDGVNGKAPYRSTYYARAYNAIGNASKTSLIYTVIDDNRLSEALELLKVREEAVDNAEERSSVKNRSSQLTGYSAQLAMIEHFYNKDTSGTHHQELRDMVLAIKDKMIALKNEAAEIGVKDQDKYYFAFPFGDLVSALYYVAGDETAATEVYNMIDPNAPSTEAYKKTVQGWKDDAAAAMFKGKALQEGFDAGIKYLEQALPLAADKSNLMSDYLERIVGATATAENQGYVYAAIRNGKTDDALKAVDYMYKKLQEVMKDANTINALPVTVKNKLIANGTSSGASMAGKYNPHGVTALAKAYIALGNNTKAAEAIKLGDNYIATLDNSIAKYDYNMALANMAKSAGDSALYEKYYNAAMAVTLDGISAATDANKAYLHILKAVDANYFKASDRVNTVNTNLSAAEQFIAKIGSDDNTFQTMANYYIYAANEYYNINNTDKMFELLQLAENAANNINKSSTKLSLFKSIVQAYGNNEQVETGYEKALEFGSDTTNRNSLIKELVTIVTSKNDFEDSEYATVDTDKDGNPDFFYPWVTAEDISQSGLTLDDDIDSDGINDNEDTLPYVVNK